MKPFLFRMPDIGEGTTQAELVAWHVDVGDQITEDQVLADVMTDKATVELSSPVHGRIVERNGEPGAMAAVGSVLLVIETQAESEAPVAPAAGPAPEPHDRPIPDAPAAGKPAKALASPAVRRMAAELGVDLSSVSGAGPHGRVLRQDLEALQQRAPAGAAKSSAPAKRQGVEEIVLRGLRKRIAEKMATSARSIPHFSYVEEVDVTEVEALREHLNARRRTDQPKLTMLAFVQEALVRVLPAFPQANATFDEATATLRRYAAVHLGVAVQTDGGLMVPVIRHAEALDLWGKARETQRLAAAARDGKALKGELSGSTITVTSLGPLGGIAATPIINHPEVAIIGPNRVQERPVVREGQVVVRKMMNISGSFDHRIVDGHDAASLIRRLKQLLEHPALIFAPE